MNDEDLPLMRETLGERDAAAGPSGSRDTQGGAIAVATPSAIRKDADTSRSPSDFAEDMRLTPVEQQKLRAAEQRLDAARATS